MRDERRLVDYVWAGPDWVWRKRKDLASAYVACLITVAWLVPPVAAAAAMSIALSGRLPWLDSGDPVLSGLKAAFVLWVALGPAAWPLALPYNVNPTSWSALRARLAELKAWMATQAPDSASGYTWQVADEVRRHVEDLDLLMAGRWPATRWTLGGSFIECWDRIHRAEEVLVTAASPAELRAAVDRDWLRVQGADGISNQLSGLLADVSRYLERDRKGWRSWLSGRRWDRASNCPRGGQATRAPHHGATDIRDARFRMRQVMATIHELRARNWAGLIHLRNHTMAALVATETIGFALLTLAITVRSTHGQLIAGWLYFLVGAAIGLLAHLVRLRRSRVAVDDYGLEEVRLALVPVVSGLAAVAGVLVMAILTSPGVASIVQVVPTSAARLGGRLPSLSSVFDLTNPGSGLLFASLFGIAPHLVVARLDDMARTYEDAIRSTQLAAAGRDHDG